MSPTSGKLFVAGWATDKGARECGYFAIDPISGSVQTLTGCRLSIAATDRPIAPDGAQAVIASVKHFSLINLKTGAVRDVKGAAGTDAVRGRRTVRGSPAIAMEGF